MLPSTHCSRFARVSLPPKTLERGAVARSPMAATLHFARLAVTALIVTPQHNSRVHGRRRLHTYLTTAAAWFDFLNCSRPTPPPMGPSAHKRPTIPTRPRQRKPRGIHTWLTHGHAARNTSVSCNACPHLISRRCWLWVDCHVI